MRKKSKKIAKSKSVEVKVNVPLTSTSFMSVIVVALLALVGYSGYLGVTSIWKFTHPQFNVSLDSLKSLPYIAKGTKIPPISAPSLAEGFNVPEEATTKYLQSVAEYKKEFRTKYPYSKLLVISENDILNFGWSLCKAQQDSIAKNIEFSKEEAIANYQSKFVLTYPQIEGLGEFLGSVAELSLLNLCGGN